MKHRQYFEAPSPTRTQEDIRSRRRMAAGYYVLRDLQSVPPLVVWWSSLTWAQQEGR